MQRPEQNPVPGTRLLRHRGDILHVTVTLTEPVPGHALLRTNIGKARVQRRSVIRHVETGSPLLEHDWHDLPMARVDDRRFAVAVPLLEVGVFEAKAVFQPEGSTALLWPEGENIVVKVQPAAGVACNTVYTAFVRLFGSPVAPDFPDRGGMKPVSEAVLLRLEEAGYAVIPRSGTFRDLIHRLDFILGTLRFRIVQLLPIHPVPTTYARMGQFGSPFAALDFKDVDPALAEFDRKTTPMDQFMELVDAVHTRGGRIFMDIPINHTGWASHLQVQHPEWFLREGDAAFRSPGAWGVKWEDLSQLDYSHRELWQYVAGVFLFWCARGVDGFRCDAGYMVPLPVWKYIVARVRDQYPDTIFLLEGLGGSLDVTLGLLSRADLDWAYSELFQVYTQEDIERYLPGCVDVSTHHGTLVHFAETHDNPRLAARSHVYARMRTSLAALLSHNGGFGITSGVEWFAGEKIDVHKLTALNWDNPDNQVEHIRRLNVILEVNPAFHEGSAPRLIQHGRHNSLAALRENKGWRENGGERHEAEKAVLVLVNLDDASPSHVSWNRRDFECHGCELVDLISGRAVSTETHGDWITASLREGEVLCLSRSREDLAVVEGVLSTSAPAPALCEKQRAVAKALEILDFFRGGTVFPLTPTLSPEGRGGGKENARSLRAGDAIASPAGGETDPESGPRPGEEPVDPADLSADPAAFCSHAVAGQPDDAAAPMYTLLTEWQWPRDANRHVVVPPGHCLLVKAPWRFTATLRDVRKVLRRESGLRQVGGGYFSVILPPDTEEASRSLSLDLDVYEGGTCRRSSTPILYPPSKDGPVVHTRFSVAEVIRGDLYALATNGIGGMAQVRGAWGEIRSQYDALLAANLHEAYPEDRQVLLTRCRAWLVREDYSLELTRDCLDEFCSVPGGPITWSFTVPAGRGRVVRLTAELTMEQGRNAVVLRFSRQEARGDRKNLDESVAVRLIIRPDIEDRVNHGKTMASSGPETSWPSAIVHDTHGFSFSPSGRHSLDVRLLTGTFSRQPEWIRGIRHPVEAGRGLDDRSDLFSPGYFEAALAGGETVTMRAEAVRHGEESTAPLPVQDHADIPAVAPLRGRMSEAAIRQFVVKRGASSTIIAGYPWFLDWGRDTLICLRGVIAAGMIREAEDILIQFARFEREGTLPNMINGGDDSNRDTSDAPLWFFVACRDLMAQRNGGDFLDRDCGGRPVSAVLRSIAEAYIRGTPNGIRSDGQSGLVYSPPHFTWMDTDNPAGTPRQGYPVEIQALWHCSLRFMATVDPGGQWSALADRVRSSIHRLFVRQPEPGNAESRIRPPQFLSDCLHAPAGMPAEEAEADDALRPNQLLAVTLGAVEDARLCAGIVKTTEELLVPGGIRSLADRPVSRPIPIVHQGHPLNDPLNPYWGTYREDEDTRRKPAYHNGTAWTWLFPSYSEALFMTYGETARACALALLAGGERVINSGCVGHVPEIMDGNAPHELRGCGAQAWGITELHRVLVLLTRNS